jgi:predicted dinucleotide-binding enzyme
MKIGILGAGNVGGTLGRRWQAVGHDVVFSSRQPGAVANAAAHAEVVVLASPWPATQTMLRQAGDLSGRILIDATNPIRADFSGLEVGTDFSGGEQVAQWAPGARVVKAFNTIGYNIMADPVVQGERALLLYCGDDAAAKQTAHKLAEELGFAPEDAGPLSKARLLEPFAMLWITLAFSKDHGREFAFRQIRRG